MKDDDEKPRTRFIILFDWDEIPNCKSINYDGFIVREDKNEKTGAIEWHLDAVNTYDYDGREHVVVPFPMEMILRIQKSDGTRQIDFRRNEAASSKAERSIEFFKMQYKKSINGWILPI